MDLHECKYQFIFGLILGIVFFILELEVFGLSNALSFILKMMPPILISYPVIGFALMISIFGLIQGCVLYYLLGSYFSQTAIIGFLIGFLGLTWWFRDSISSLSPTLLWSFMVLAAVFVIGIIKRKVSGNGDN